MACEQLTLVQSDLSPIDIASYLYLQSTVSLHVLVIGNMISNKNGLKMKLKRNLTVDIQIKGSGLRVSNSKVFPYFCVKSKLEELRGHKEIPALSNAFYL